MNIHNQCLKWILQSRIGEELQEVEPIKGGHSGFTYSVRTKKNSYVVKLAQPIGSDLLGLEKPEQRVYGGRAKSFESSHRLLLTQQMPTFQLLAYGFPTEKVPYFYQILSKLPGYSIREHLSINKTKKAELEFLAGEEFGKLHLITRRYDGWADQKTPYLTNWKESFFLALERRVYHLSENYLSKPDIKKISRFMKDKYARWTDPDDFVFSHVDGLQGMVSYQNKWKFNGFIDLEDYRFTDQRFVLSGFEIGSHYSLSNASNAFWRGYKKFKEIDASYDVLKDLFKLFYFSSWVQMTNEGTGEIGHSFLIKKFLNRISSIIEKKG
jgi:hypothetical protein